MRVTSKDPPQFLPTSVQRALSCSRVQRAPFCARARGVANTKTKHQCHRGNWNLLVGSHRAEYLPIFLVTFVILLPIAAKTGDPSLGRILASFAFCIDATPRRSPAIVTGMDSVTVPFLAQEILLLACSSRKRVPDDGKSAKRRPIGAAITSAFSPSHLTLPPIPMASWWRILNAYEGDRLYRTQMLSRKWVSFGRLSSYRILPTLLITLMIMLSIGRENRATRHWAEYYLVLSFVIEATPRRSPSRSPAGQRRDEHLLARVLWSAPVTDAELSSEFTTRLCSSCAHRKCRSARSYRCALGKR